MGGIAQDVEDTVCKPFGSWGFNENERTSFRGYEMRQSKEGVLYRTRDDEG